MLDKKIFVTNMTALFEIYDTEQTKAKMDIYYSVLQDMSNEDFIEAVKETLKNRVYSSFPKPAELLSYSDNKDEDQDETMKLAKSMYDKFYAENCAMTDYASARRDKIPNDREFFEATDYANLKKSTGEPAYTKQELYVLNELGGGAWLLDIRFHQNSNNIVKRIAKIIKKAKSFKSAGIESKRVTNMIRIKNGSNI